jgi:hypothetical protein
VDLARARAAASSSSFSLCSLNSRSNIDSPLGAAVALDPEGLREGACELIELPEGLRTTLPEAAASVGE